MKKNLLIYLLLSIILLPLTGCVSFRSDVQGLYTSQSSITKKKPVKVFFDLYHYKKDSGLDVIPKLLNYPGTGDFDDIFKESLKQLTNIGGFETFTNYARDISDKARLQKRDSAVSRADYTVKIEIFRDKSFAKHFLGGLVSTVSMTVIPIGFSWDYTTQISVIDNENSVIAKYTRSASVSTWWQFLATPFYPFYTEEKKTEEIYLEMMSDIFRQIDSESVLKL